MTDIVERAKQSLEGVTPGPWKESLLDGLDYEDGSSCYRGGIYDTTVAHIPVFLASGGIDKRDARFIAAARTLVPELIAEVERLRGLVGSRGKWNPEWGSPYDVMGDV